MSIQLASEKLREYQQAIVLIVGPFHELFPSISPLFHSKCLFETLYRPLVIECAPLS